jgi:hypothetical protein
MEKCILFRTESSKLSIIPAKISYESAKQAVEPLSLKTKSFLAKCRFVTKGHTLQRS